VKALGKVLPCRALKRDTQLVSIEQTIATDPCEAGACNLVCEYSLSIQMELPLPIVERSSKDLVDGSYQYI
jgi:hypothetical protein